MLAAMVTPHPVLKAAPIELMISKRVAVPPSSGNNQGNDKTGINFRYSIDENGNSDGYWLGVLCLRHLATGTTGTTINTGILLTSLDIIYYQWVKTKFEQC